MRSITVLLISITLSLSLAPPLAAQDRSYPSPTLEPLLEGDEGYVRSDYFGAPRRHIDGMAVELDETRLTYPLAGSIFFEEGSADLPERSIRSSSPAEVVGFTDTTIPGGTLQKYTRILDILGFRMRSHAGARITLTAARQLAATGGRLALATMCIGVGQGIALLVERV